MKRCDVCVKRDRERGGNADCPLERTSRGEFERGVRECRYFLLGDRRLAVVHTDEADRLFAV